MNLKIFLIGAMLAGTTTVHGVTFDAPQKLTLPTAGAHPMLSPDGTKMLYTSDNHCGLIMLDMNTMATTTIDEAPAAGFNPAFSPDSRSVVYRTADTRDGLTVRDIRVYDIVGGKSRVKADFSRSTDNALQHTNALTYAMADYDHIVINHNGLSTRINPLTDAHTYLWASLSPDGKHLLFSEPFKGVFVSNADGSNPIKLASKGDFPSWVDNNTIVYVLSHDDGYVILDSTLMSVSIDGSDNKQLTDSSMLVGEASAADGRVVFSTLNGDIYLMKAQ